MNGPSDREILKREGTGFLSCYPRNPLIESAGARHPTILCRQERVGVGIADAIRAQPWASATVFRRPAGARHREPFRYRPGPSPRTFRC